MLCTWIILNHSMDPPGPGPWKNCLPWNWSLVPKRLGTTALNNRKLFSHSMEATSPRLRCLQVGAFWGLSPRLVNGYPLSVSSLGFPSCIFICILISSSYKDTSHIRLMPTHMTPFKFNCLFTDTISKIQSHCEVLGLVLQHVIWGIWGTVYSMTSKEARLVTFYVR